MVGINLPRAGEGWEKQRAAPKIPFFDGLEGAPGSEVTETKLGSFCCFFFAFRVMKFLFEWTETLGRWEGTRLRLGAGHGWSPVERKDVGFEFPVPVPKPCQVVVLGEGAEKSELQVLFALFGIFLGMFGFFAVATRGDIFRISPEMLLRASLSCLGSKAVPGGFELKRALIQKNSEGFCSSELSRSCVRSLWLCVQPAGHSQIPAFRTGKALLSFGNP